MAQNAQQKTIVENLKRAQNAKTQAVATNAQNIQNATNVNSSNPYGVAWVWHLTTAQGQPYVQWQSQWAPILDLSNYVFGQNARTEQAISNRNNEDWLRMRNLNIANQMAGAGINNRDAVSNALATLPWWSESPEADRLNTTNNIMNMLQNGDATNPALQKFSNQYMQNWVTNPWIANRFSALGNEYGAVSDAQRAILEGFRQYENGMNPYMNNYQNAAVSIDKDLTGRLWELKTQFEGQYWPWGQQERRIQDYYSGLADIIAADQIKNNNEVDAQARKFWASAWAARAARQAALQNNMKLAVEYKKQEVADYDNIYRTLNDYTNAFIQAYGNSKDANVKNTYAQLLDWRNALWQALLSSMWQLEQYKIEDAAQQAAKTGISIRDL